VWFNKELYNQNAKPNNQCFFFGKEDSKLI